jgi:hypothetical protein
MLTQLSLGSREPLLAMRRQLAMLMGDQSEAAACWLEHARLCRSVVSGRLRDRYGTRMRQLSGSAHRCG